MQATQPARRKVGKEIHRLDIRIRRYIDLHAGLPKMDAVSYNNLRIMRFLADHEGRDVYQKDLEAEFGITRSTASKVLRLMEEKGMIKRLSVAHDARLKKLVMTDRSREFSNQMRRNGEKMDCVLLCGFTAEEEAQLYGFLDRMLHNLDIQEDF